MAHSHSTIRDVAREAGVSHQTVSRVINRSANVLPETRKRIEAAIETLGFRPSAIARSMAQGRTNTLACISPNLTDYTLASYIEGAEIEARQNGFFLLSSSVGTEDMFLALVDELVGHRRVDGLIVINPYIDGRYKSVPQNFPVVFVGAQSRNRLICSVSLEDEKAAYDATNHLVSLGHRKIAMVTGPLEEDCSRDRSSGYIRALEEAGIVLDREMIITGDWSATSGQKALLALTNQESLPSAVFAQNDRMALGVLHTAREMGMHVPEQLAVVGVDDMPLSSYFDPPLTTMHQDMLRIGLEATRMLLRTINQSIEPCTQVKLPAHLIMRQSTLRTGGA